MAGVFSKANRPRFPGSYFNWIGAPRAVVPEATGGIVAIAGTHDYGPDESVRAVDSLGDFQAQFGPSQNTELFRAVRMAFTGEDFAGLRGARRVLVFRMVGAAGAKSLKALSNTTPAPALTLTARASGSYGDQLRVTVQDLAGDSTKTELILYLGTVEVERYTFADTDITAAAAAINANSDWVTAAMNITGVALGLVSSQAFAGGNDGSTLLAADYTAWMAAIDSWRFGYMAAANLTDTSIMTSIGTWAKNHNAAGKRFTFVTGGATDELASAAVSRAALFNDGDFVTIGMGHFHDDDLNVDLSPAQAAPRWAGILSARGESMGSTYARMKGWSLVNGPSQAAKIQCFDGGVTVFGRDSNEESPVRAETSMTTYITTTNADKPYDVWRDPKFVATMHAIETELTEWGDTFVIGRLAVNDNTRDFVRAEARSRLADRERLYIIQRDWSADVDQDPPPTDNDDFVAIRIGVQFSRDVQKVYWTAFVG